MTVEPSGQPSAELAVPAPRAGRWTVDGPPAGLVPIVVGLRLIHHPLVIEAAGELLNGRLGWAFQRGNVLPSHRDPTTVRMYGNLLVPISADVVGRLTEVAPTAPPPRRGRR